jgi:hypothetical protein
MRTPTITPGQIFARAGVRACLLVLVALAVLATAPAMARAASAPWTAITSPGANNTTVSPIPDIAWDGTNLWMAWGDDAFDVNVKRWNGASWTSYGQPGTGTTKNKMPSITWDGSKPWVAWNDDSFAVQVAYWNGASWTQIASPGTATSINSTPDLLYANGTLYAAWQDSTRTPQVAQWNGASWSSLGAPGAASGVNSYPNLAWNGTELYVAWADTNLVRVARRVAGAWSNHSTFAVTTTNTLPSIEFVGTRLYLMHDQAPASGIEWWDGSQYRSVPSPGGGPTVFVYGTLLWTGSRFWASYVIDPDNVEIARYDPVAPAAPTSPTQLEADGATVIAGGAWTRFGATLNLLLRSTMTDTEASEQLTSWTEIVPNATAFSATCGQSASSVFAGPAVAAPTGGTGVSGTSTVTGLLNNTPYHWRTCTVDRFGFHSGWTSKGGSPDLRIDTSVPAAAGSSPADAATGVSVTPTLSATYTDPAPANSGTVDFQLCTTAACGTVLQSTTSASTASGATASWSPTTLAFSTTYCWRVRATDGAGNQQASWSTAQSFTTTAASVTIGVDNANLALGTTMAGFDTTALSVFSVSPNSPGGYQLLVRDESDGWGFDSVGGATIPDWTGTSAAPSAWAANLGGGFGMTVLGVTGPGAKDTARWGTGSTPTDFANNRYAGLKATSDVLAHQRTSFSAGTDTVTVGWRVDVTSGQAATTYDATTNWTAVALP